MLSRQKYLSPVEMPPQVEKFTDDGSSQASLQDLQHAGLEEARLLQSELLDFTENRTPHRLLKHRSRWHCSIQILQAAFFLSATVCVWIIAF